MVHKKVSKKLTKVAGAALDEAQSVVSSAEEQIERVTAPVRENILKRFPTLFLLATTFGITATVVGMEQLLVQSELLGDRPGVILTIGVLILITTGTLYKKLG